MESFKITIDFDFVSIAYWTRFFLLIVSLFTVALADVAKGNETVEYACSLPQLCQGKSLKVSSQVTCTDHRAPLGIVASIVPFNFPFMVRKNGKTKLTM